VMEKAITRFENRDLLAKADQVESDVRRGVVNFDDIEWFNQNRSQIDNARRPMVNWVKSGVAGKDPFPQIAVDDPHFPEDKFGAVWQSMVKAYKGEHDPDIHRGGPVAAATGVDNLLTQALGLYSDAWLGGKAAKPVVTGLGATLKAGHRITKPIRDPAIQYAMRKLNATEPGRKAVSYTTQLLNSAEDFRKGIALFVEETKTKRAAEARNARIENAINGYSRKLAKSGKNVHGNILEGTKWDLPELQGKMTGNFVDQLIYLWGEAGDEASFFTEPEVLQIAAKRGIDPQFIQRIGDEAKQLQFDAGMELVGSGLMDAETFVQHAGSYNRRNYWLMQMSPEEAARMAADMAARGETDSPHFALVQHIAHHGGGSGKYSRTKGLNPTGVVRERELMTPQERLAYLPDLSYIRSSRRSVVGQFQAAAQARILKNIADPELGLSLANKLESTAWDRGDKLKQPKFQAELQKIGSRLKSLQNDADKPKGLNNQYKELTSRVTKAQEEVKHHGQVKVQHQVAEPLPPTPPPPPAPARPAPGWRSFFRPGFKDTASQRVGKQFAAKQVSGGATTAKLRIADLKHSETMRKYAAELSEYQKAHEKWAKRGAEIDEQWNVAKAKMDKALVEQDTHVKAMDAHAELTAKIERRRDLIEGKRGVELRDAQDALSDALKKVDPEGTFQMTPDQEAHWNQVWLEHWDKYNTDIFSDIPPTGLPHAPKGVDPKIVQAMGENNPLIAVALDETLSAADGVISEAAARARGWVRWDGDYGPMENRWASGALKHFLDDAMNPDRYLGESKGFLAGVSKYLGESVRTLKLYTNPLTHLAIYIQSHFEGMATVADAGKSFDVKAYHAGMKEWGEYIKGDGPITPTVQAVLDSGIDMGGSPRTGVDPLITSPEAPNPNKPLILKAKDWGKQSFVDMQVFPKAGVVKVLTEQGMSPSEAARWAEKGYGGQGIVQGGIETPGVHRLLETLNRSGVAMFTAYPLHSMNRIMQLMTTNPQIAMQYPILRHYLMQQATDEIREEERQGRIRPTEIPLPFLKNPDGGQAVMDVANLIPHGGAFGEISPPSVLEGFFRARAENQRGRRPGLNPIDQSTRELATSVKAQLPGTINRVKQFLDAASGKEPSDYATQPQTVGQAAAGLLALPMRDITTASERKLEVDKADIVKERWEFMEKLEAEMMKGVEIGPDLSNHPEVRNLDYAGVAYRLAAVYGETRKLTSKGHYPISDKRAKTMIRHQIAFAQALLGQAKKTTPRMLSLEERARLQSLQGE
jgi:hypothetical protein